MFTAAHCPRLTEKSQHITDSVRSHCSSASHGTVLNASRNLEVAGSICGAEASAAAPTPQQVLMPSVIDRRLLKQLTAFDGDRTKWANWAFTFRENASAVSTRTVVFMEHAQGEIEPLDLPTAPSDRQVNVQVFCVLAMLVKDGATKNSRNGPLGHGSEIWSLLFGEYEPRQRRRFQAMRGANLKVQLREPLGEALDSF